jgi:hypothetical protein
MMALLGSGLERFECHQQPASPTIMDVRYLLASLLAAVTLIASDCGDAEEAADPSMIARGSYLARAADCMPCHTSARDKAYAGGLRMNTPFGVMYSPNITPDRETGIGTWTFDEFKKAVHSGIRADGKFLYPTMPFDAFTQISEDDLRRCGRISAAFHPSGSRTAKMT